MTSPRPHLRLVGPPRDDGGDEPVRDDETTHEDGGGDPALPPDAFADVADDPNLAARLQRMAVVALVALQALATLNYAGKYATLATAGGAYALAALLAAPAALCLYAGAVLLALRPGRGRALFLVAVAGLGLSIPFWGVSFGWTWPVAFGAMLGLAGAWFARPPVTPAEDDGPEHDAPQVIALDDFPARRDR